MSAPPPSLNSSGPRRPARGRRPAWWLGLVLLGLCALPLRADVPKEYQLKAAFLYNFTKFIEWPPARFADANSPIVIGVLGENPFGGELEKIVRGRTVNGRAILVRTVNNAGEGSAVHLLFVPAGEEPRLPEVAPPAAAIVTIGESRDFAALGGMITFTRVDDKLRFEINMAAAERRRLKINAQLQKLATVVRHQP